VKLAELCVPHRSLPHRGPRPCHLIPTMGGPRKRANFKSLVQLSIWGIDSYNSSSLPSQWDCSVRAIAVVCGLSYGEAHKLFAACYGTNRIGAIPIVSVPPLIVFVLPATSL
jgi:hypothetical protein